MFEAASADSTVVFVRLPGGTGGSGGDVRLVAAGRKPGGRDCLVWDLQMKTR